MTKHEAIQFSQEDCLTFPSFMLEVSVNLYSAKSFYMMGVDFVILRIVIIFFGLLKPFAVFITIEKFFNFPIWNSFPLLFRINICSFFFLFRNASVPHIIFSTS